MAPLRMLRRDHLRRLALVRSVRDRIDRSHTCRSDGARKIQRQIKAPQGRGNSHGSHETYKYAYVLIIARKGIIMEQMIAKKNKMLREAGAALKEVWELACMINETECRTSASHRTFTELVNGRLRSLSYNYDQYIDESELALPEAEQETTIDELDALDELDELEEDLPFVTPEEKENE